MAPLALVFVARGSWFPALALVALALAAPRLCVELARLRWRPTAATSSVGSYAATIVAYSSRLRGMGLMIRWSLESGAATTLAWLAYSREFLGALTGRELERLPLRRQLARLQGEYGRRVYELGLAAYAEDANRVAIARRALAELEAWVACVQDEHAAVDRRAQERIRAARPDARQWHLIADEPTLPTVSKYDLFA